MPEYAVAAAVACVVVVALELAVFRTGVFRHGPYWIALGICTFFMLWVNGWLTKLSAPIVLYAPDMKSPWRFPWDIPVEDYLFGFALLTITMVLWDRAGRRPEDRASRRNRPDDRTRDAGAGR
jgi:lycopene cyclase domain-containing protein